jgi:hypothetical protein
MRGQVPVTGNRPVGLTAEAVLINHQRRDGGGGCICSWFELGRSFAGHQVAELDAAGVLRPLDELPRRMP